MEDRDPSLFPTPGVLEFRVKFEGVFLSSFVFLVSSRGGCQNETILE